MVPLRKSDKLMLIAGALAIGFGLIQMIDLYQEQQRFHQATEEERSEWCYTKTIQPGESISESGPGNYTYSLIMTSKGVDIYIKCSELP